MRAGALTRSIGVWSARSPPSVKVHSVPTMNESERLPDRWRSRDCLVLCGAPRRTDAGRDPDRAAIAAVAAIVRHEVDRVLDAFEDDRSIRTQHGVRRARGDLGTPRSLEPLGAHCRTVGMRPDGDRAADAVVEELNEVTPQTQNEDHAGALRKTGRLLRSVPSAISADVTAALIRQQTRLT